MLLHETRLLQQIGTMFLAFLNGLLRGLALDDSPFQVAVGGSQFHRASAQCLRQSTQVAAGLPRGTMSRFDRGDGLYKKDSRPLDRPILGTGGMAWQQQSCEGDLVNPGQVQRLQPEVHGFASQAARRLQTGSTP